MNSYKNFSEKLEKVRNNGLSLIDNVEFFLDAIEKNKDLNAFNFIFPDATGAAKKISQKIKNGTAGKAAGLVVAIKDNLAIKDKPLTCSSKILKDFRSLYTSTAVKKLLEEDAIIIGKTNCDEFAMGSSNETSAFGPVKNPYDKTRVSGGSSGGSAVAVAANLCDVALGSDTGGSIRQPASFCGVYGLKPTYGRVSRYGLTAFASSFDSIGPFANNISDIKLVLDLISGKDVNDSTSYQLLISEQNETRTKTLKIGIPDEYFGEGLDQGIKIKVENVINNLNKLNVDFVSISLPHTEYAIATYYILTTAEASSNLSRYDGARYGFRAAGISNLDDMYTQSRSQGFGTEVKRRIMLGTYVLSSGYYDAYYRKAQKVRRLLKQDFDNAFEKVDLILTPTTPTTAFKIGEKSDDPLEMYLNDIYTTPANLAGIPALNIPIGLSKNNLPVGMQLMANLFDESKLFYAAQLIEKIKENINER